MQYAQLTTVDRDSPHTSRHRFTPATNLQVDANKRRSVVEGKKTLSRQRSEEGLEVKKKILRGYGPNTGGTLGHGSDIDIDIDKPIAPIARLPYIRKLST
jgi:hypothetical protein